MGQGVAPVGAVGSGQLVCAPKFSLLPQGKGRRAQGRAGLHRAMVGGSGRPSAAVCWLQHNRTRPERDTRHPRSSAHVHLTSVPAGLTSRVWQGFCMCALPQCLTG